MLGNPGLNETDLLFSHLAVQLCLLRSFREPGSFRLTVSPSPGALPGLQDQKAALSTSVFSDREERKDVEPGQVFPLSK